MLLTPVNMKIKSETMKLITIKAQLNLYIRLAIRTKQH